MKCGYLRVAIRLCRSRHGIFQQNRSFPQWIEDDFIFCSHTVNIYIYILSLFCFLLLWVEHARNSDPKRFEYTHPCLAMLLGCPVYLLSIQTSTHRKVDMKEFTKGVSEVARVMMGWGSSLRSQKINAQVMVMKAAN